MTKPSKKKDHFSIHPALILVFGICLLLPLLFVSDPGDLFTLGTTTASGAKTNTLLCALLGLVFIFFALRQLLLKRK